MHLRLLHMGDLHGHLLPRPHLREDGSSGKQGGLARLYTLIQRLRAECAGSLLFNTGDTIQGSAEALFTRGQALVEVLDHFGIDGFAPGNWDYLYGKARFLELFGPGSAGHGACRWGAVAANVYDDTSGALLLPPYRLIAGGGRRIAVIGLSSERAINAMGPWVTEGIRFSKTAEELGPLLATITAHERPDLIVLLSEFGLAKNILIAERHPQIGVVLSSDMHEETREPVRTASGTLISEVGQDGTRLGQFDLRIEDGRAVDWEYRLHVIDAALEADPDIAAVIKAVRRPFVSGAGFTPHVNPLNGTTLKTPIDTVVGQARVALHRSGFAHDPVPAVLHGTSSQYLAEAFRRQANADIGHMRGFRYGTQVAPGPITLEDLYHYMPIGPQLAVAAVSGRQLIEAVERSADGVFNPDPFKWTGGWMDAYAGLRFSLDAGASKGQRTADHCVQRCGEASWNALDPQAHYQLAGYWFAREPRKVGGLEAEAQVLTTSEDKAVDAVDWVARDLRDHAAEPDMDTLQQVGPLPPPRHGNPELQPLAGVHVGSENSSV